jgi:hypothetical protein
MRAILASHHIPAVGCGADPESAISMAPSVLKGELAMTQSEKWPILRTYFSDREDSLSEIENKKTEEAVDRCRELAKEIKSIRLQKKINRCTDVSSLADFQMSLERAASVTRTERCR